MPPKDKAWKDMIMLLFCETSPLIRRNAQHHTNTLDLCRYVTAHHPVSLDVDMKAYEGKVMKRRQTIFRMEKTFKSRSFCDIQSSKHTEYQLGIR